jgi:EmrB/QacA subfamily drug resistance transporter
MLLATRYNRSRKSLILAGMTCCLSILFLDSTLIPIALPSIQKELGFSGLFLQWMINIFYLTTAILVIFSGKLSDIFGRRRIFCIGLLFYAGGSFLAAFSINAYFFLVIRGVQGVGAALMTPSAMSIILSEFKSEKLGRALGVSAGISSVFLTTGPLIAGLIAELFSWRIIFLVPIPICILGLILTLLHVPKADKKNVQIDVKGLILLMMGLGTLMFALMQAKYWGWLSIQLLNYTVISIVILSIFYHHSYLIEHPLLDFRIFKNKNFFVGLVIAFLTQFTGVYTVFMAIFFQKALYLTPIESGLYIVVANLPILFGAPVSGILADKKGAIFPLRFGLFHMLISMMLLIFYTFYQSQLILLVSLALFGFSNSLIMTPVGTLALKDVDHDKKGVASGVYHTVRFLGSSFGILCLGSVGYVFRMLALKGLLLQYQLPEWVQNKKIDEILKLPGKLNVNEIFTLKMINTRSFFYSLNAMSFLNCLVVSFSLLLTFVYLNDYKKALRV